MQENNEIKYLKLEDVIPNRLQPRTEFDEEKLNELANSIKQYGIINPLLVRNVGNKYEIIAGERRYKASILAGLTEVPAIISNMDDSTSAEVAIIENIQRQDLTALEEAKSYRKLLDQGNITQEQLAQKMGKTQSTIANKMRLLHLCDEVQEALENNQISERHARSLLQLKDINDQREMLEKIIENRMTVKATETAIKELLQTKTLNLNNEIINNNIPTSQTLSENIYGNDVVNIMDLNKKELEKENDNMNNNEQNIQMNQPVMPNTINSNTQAMAAPAFGERFFPSLEDQETNLNLSNPFEIPTPPKEPMSQPMMESLLEPQQPLSPVAPSPAPTENSINIPSFVTNSQPLPSISTPIDNNLPQNSAPLVTPETQEPLVNQIPDFINNMVPQTPGVTQTPIKNNIVAEPIINPIANNEQNIPTTPSIEQPIMNQIPATPLTPPIMDLPPQTEFMSQPQEFSIGITPEPVSPAPVQEPQVLAPKTTDNIINAINAIKNLALSIESIGYKATIKEDDTPNTYKITIELEK